MLRGFAPASAAECVLAPWLRWQQRLIGIDFDVDAAIATRCTAPPARRRTTDRPLPKRSWERLRAVLAKGTASGAATAAPIGGTERRAVEAFAFLGDVDG